MAALTLPVISNEFIYFPGILAFDQNSPDHAADPTSFGIQVAVKPQNVSPSGTDWKTGTWVNTTTARILQSALAPQIGLFVIWLRIIGATEQPARPVGNIQFI